MYQLIGWLIYILRMVVGWKSVGTRVLYIHCSSIWCMYELRMYDNYYCLNQVPAHSAICGVLQLALKRVTDPWVALVQSRPIDERTMYKN